MKRTKQEKAITLIALIITIIILLILAVVTINAIQGDEGLITKANNAAKKYKDAASEENSLIQKYLAQIPEENGSSEEDGQSGEVPEELKKYILGSNLTGRVLYESDGGILDDSSDENYVFIDETSTINGNEVKYCGEICNLYETVFYVEYKNVIYKFNAVFEEQSSEPFANTDMTYGVKRVGNKIVSTSISAIEVGSTISYDGKTWTVMYVNENNIQMISNDALYYNGNQLELGHNDTYLTAKGNLQGSTELEKAIYSYNNAITTLNSACDEIVTKASFVTDVRCVGSNPNSKNSESSSYYTSNFLTTYPTNNPGAYNGVGKDTDTNFLTDYEKLVCLGKITAANDEYYWLASRFVGYENQEEVFFSVRDVWSIRTYVLSYVFRIFDTNTLLDSWDKALRPVVTIDTTKCIFSYDSGNNYFTVSTK